MAEFELASKAESNLTEKEHLFAFKMQQAIQTFTKITSE
jgi:hypothetical protein